LTFLRRAIAVPLLACALAGAAPAEERFPPPQFETAYQRPRTTAPWPRADWREYVDLAMLVSTLTLASYLALRARRRGGMFALMLFCLAYFGFYRQGCVCPIGAIQNVSRGIADGGFVVPVTVVAFFCLPLAFTLLFGRTFCAGVCPLGAIQDLVILKPLKVPAWVEHSLGLLAWVYLGGAVLLAAAGSAFIICRYDPFVGLFRLSAEWTMLVMGGSLLLVGAFVPRPYCRFLCPYGALLRVTSLLSRRHATVTPDECIRCRLCEDSCPFGAILKPTEPLAPHAGLQGKRLLAGLILLLPVLAAGGAWLGGLASGAMSRADYTVLLADRVRLDQAGLVQGDDQYINAFRVMKLTPGELYDLSRGVQDRFRRWGRVFGGFLGVVIGLKLLRLSVRRTRQDYAPNRSTCLSCGRCFAYCPIERKRRGTPCGRTNA